MNDGASHGAARKRMVRIPRPLLVFLTLSSILISANHGCGQQAFIDDAWWTYQQDCNGDGCQAGTLPGDKARLNWNPDFTNCIGTLTVYEKVSYKACGSNSWMLLYTTPLHTIVGCRSSDAQTLDVVM